MVTLAQAATVMEAALRYARGANLPPMTVAVLDAGGHLVAFQREDGSSLFRERIARAKAMGALGMGMGSRAFVDRAAHHPAFFNALSVLSDGGIAPVPGGVLVRSGQGALIGAVGVSGHLPDEDEACAVAGIRAAQLNADTGAS